jgi:hypothetical protein
MKDSLERRNMAAIVDEMTINDKTIEVYNFNTFVTHQNPNKSNVSVYVGPESKDFKKLKKYTKLITNHGGK